MYRASVYPQSVIRNGGPDWTPKSNGNELFLGRLQHDHEWDMLVTAWMPDGLSRYNPIEHLWLSCSHWLAGVSIPLCLPGESIGKRGLEKAYILYARKDNEKIG